jgi:hypothetical protein
MVTVRAICRSSRPMAAQWARRIVSRSAIRAGSPYAFHMSAYLAVVRSVLRGPEPPIKIGSRDCAGRGATMASRIW